MEMELTVLFSLHLAAKEIVEWKIEKWTLWRKALLFQIITKIEAEYSICISHVNLSKRALGNYDMRKIFIRFWANPVATLILLRVHFNS